MLKHEYYSLGDDIFLKHLQVSEDPQKRWENLVAILEAENKALDVMADARRRYKNMKLDLGMVEARIRKCKEIKN